MHTPIRYLRILLANFTPNYRIAYVQPSKYLVDFHMTPLLDSFNSIFAVSSKLLLDLDTVIQLFVLRRRQALKTQFYSIHASQL